MLAYSASLTLRRFCRPRPATSLAGASASRRLLGSVIALALGLAAVAASLMPFAGGSVEVIPPHARIGVSQIVPAEEEPLDLQSGAMASARTKDHPPRGGREFLLRMASRLHAPAAAYTMGGQPTPPPCCPR